MSLHPTRRGFLAGSLLLPLTTTAAEADNDLSSPPPSNEVAALLRRRDELLEQQRQLDERWKVANVQLPDWCKPGHKYRDNDGKEFGPLEGWPPIPEVLAVKERFVLLRPSLRDLTALFDLERCDDPNEARVNYRRRVRLVRRAVTQRRKVEAELGLPRTKDWLPIDLEIEAIEARLSLANGADEKKLSLAKDLSCDRTSVA
jgi:hypothetical protein